jgi:glycosyltransferase involved in cell wall biosynthesis
LTDVTAILAIRNEAAVLGNCLRHLVRNGVRVALIDNDSTDASADIYRAAEFAPHIVEVRRLPFTGAFSLRAQLDAKLAVAGSLDGGWILHVDADEMMHSYRPGETLAEGLARLGEAGWNAVNFDEFVFLPIERDYASDVEGFPDLSLYYFHEPTTPRLMRAWRAGHGFSMAESGGHTLAGPGLRLAPESFALRHYMFRSQAHAREKYVDRAFDPGDLRLGWHAQRIGRWRRQFHFPPAARLKRLAEPDDRALDKSAPWRRHYWNR